MFELELTVKTVHNLVKSITGTINANIGSTIRIEDLRLP